MTLSELIVILEDLRQKHGDIEVVFTGDTITPVWHCENKAGSMQLGGHTCPVCGYDDMTNPPEDFHICECCGTEFDSDDIDYTHEELRHRWIAGGKQWWSKRICPPYHWDADQQLAGV